MVVAGRDHGLDPVQAEDAVAKGHLRADLFYRLNVVPIHLPALRERADDIEALARHFLAQATSEGLPRRQLTADAIALLRQQPWRGNVRELRNLLFRLALLARDEVVDATVIEPLLAQAAQGEAPAAEVVSFDAAVRGWLVTARPGEGEVYDAALAEFERPLFATVLAQTGGNQLRAARVLGINRNTLRKRLTQLGLIPEGSGAR